MTYRAAMAQIASALKGIDSTSYYDVRTFGRLTLERTLSPTIRAKGSRKFNLWGLGGATDPRNGAWHYNDIDLIVDYDWHSDVRLLDDVMHEDAVLIGHTLRDPANWDVSNSGIVNLMLGDREEFAYELASIEEDGRPVGRRLTVSFPLTYQP